jgi:hypothetical protein
MQTTLQSKEIVYKNGVLENIKRIKKFLFIKKFFIHSMMQIFTRTIILYFIFQLHKELRAYTELMHWMKAMRSKLYDVLTDVYNSSLSKIYERDLKIFFSQVST